MPISPAQKIGGNNNSQMGIIFPNGSLGLGRDTTKLSSICWFSTQSSCYPQSKRWRKPAAHDNPCGFNGRIAAFGSRKRALVDPGQKHCPDRTSVLCAAGPSNAGSVGKSKQYHTLPWTSAPNFLVKPKGTSLHVGDEHKSSF